MLAQEIEAIVKPIKMSIDQACNKIVTEIGSQDSNKTLRQGFLSVEQACNYVVAKIGSQDSNKILQQGFLSVEQACNKIVAKLGNQDADHTLQQGFNVREQILDNARILWPILEAKRFRDGSSANSSVQRVTPPMTVVVGGHVNGVYAVVLRHEHERTGSPSYRFIRSVGTHSAEKAMHMLLDVTMVLIAEEAEELMRIGISERKVDVAGKGCWY
ncbi:hypothetical protein LTR10_000198 [Elasticomyces elasticus]|nr:hypothetical protein LTR10_000198 [Elasticomyces elasticus]KAK4980543.1 hypothetical protein LTR42_000851 [Elasticomyces elasticus]